MAALERDLTELYAYLFCLCYTYPAEQPKKKDVMGMIVHGVVMTMLLASWTQ
jgi:hypothetical protein